MAGVRSIIANIDFRMPSGGIHMGHRGRNDPFGSLPYDIVYNICRHLPPSSITRLAQASYSVHCVTRINANFWKILLKTNFPWFFEIHALIESGEIDRGYKLKGIFMWTEAMIQERRGLSGVLLNLVNRRRIWSVCEKLARRYHMQQLDV
ncbi:hypothetical protein F4677DRAFT_428413 [Hypoxylon crocopeplum]|nr:hypothetical protein F4677DRAFT_428413 [Hypoxylon crocopeplum]